MCVGGGALGVDVGVGVDGLIVEGGDGEVWVEGGEGAERGDVVGARMDGKGSVDGEGGVHLQSTARELAHVSRTMRTLLPLLPLLPA